MYKVKTYIDIYHKGRLDGGTGTYTGVLEHTKNEIPYTREFVKIVEGTTKNRTGLLGCIEALGRLNKKCEVDITINSHYIVQTFNQSWYLKWLSNGVNAKNKPVANLELWAKLDQEIKKHQVTFTYQDKNMYSAYMKMKIEENKEEI